MTTNEALTQLKNAGIDDEETTKRLQEAGVMVAAKIIHACPAGVILPRGYQVTYDAQCNCGYGCPPHTCKNSRRHWFATINRGEPFDSDTAKAVMTALMNTGLIREEK